LPPDPRNTLENIARRRRHGLRRAPGAAGGGRAGLAGGACVPEAHRRPARALVRADAGRAPGPAGLAAALIASRVLR